MQAAFLSVTCFVIDKIFSLYDLFCKYLPLLTQSIFITMTEFWSPMDSFERMFQWKALVKPSTEISNKSEFDISSCLKWAIGFAT